MGADADTQDKHYTCDMEMERIYNEWLSRSHPFPIVPSLSCMENTFPRGHIAKLADKRSLAASDCRFGK